MKRALIVLTLIVGTAGFAAPAIAEGETPADTTAVVSEPTPAEEPTPADEPAPVKGDVPRDTNVPAPTPEDQDAPSLDPAEGTESALVTKSNGTKRAPAEAPRTVASVPVVSAALEPPDPDDEDLKKVSLCHRTSAVDNPYRIVTVSVSGGAEYPGQHDSHDDGGSAGELGNGIFDPNAEYDPPEKNWSDIIPPYGDYPGLNWSELGQEIYANNCQLPGDEPEEPSWGEPSIQPATCDEDAQLILPEIAGADWVYEYDDSVDPPVFHVTIELLEGFELEVLPTWDLEAPLATGDCVLPQEVVVPVFELSDRCTGELLDEDSDPEFVQIEVFDAAGVAEELEGDGIDGAWTATFTPEDADEIDYVFPEGVEDPFVVSGDAGTDADCPATPQEEETLPDTGGSSLSLLLIGLVLATGGAALVLRGQAKTQRS